MYGMQKYFRRDVMNVEEPVRIFRKGIVVRSSLRFLSVSFSVFICQIACYLPCNNRKRFRKKFTNPAFRTGFGRSLTQKLILWWQR